MEDAAYAVRLARPEDLPAITEIYNEAILTTDATFDTEPKTLEEQRRWFEGHDERHPIMVVEVAGRVVGWASLSEWSDRRAYAATAEVSLYIRGEYRGRGLGRRLLAEVLREGERRGFHTVLARITAGNDISLRLHRQAGFEEVGVMREVGWKAGRWLDVLVMQKIYPGQAGT